jgi:hypothetical protein
LAGGSVVQFVWPFSNDQRATGLSGDGQLRRQPEIERIDGLDAQPTWILRQIPSTGRGACQCGVSKRAHSSALRTRRINLTS